RARHGHSRDLRAARRVGADARLLPRSRAREGEARRQPREDVSPGRGAAMGVPHAPGRQRPRAREADPTLDAFAWPGDAPQQKPPVSDAPPRVAALARVPRAPYDHLAVPDLLLGLYDWVIAWDHQAGRAWLISTGMPERGAPAARRAAARLAFVKERVAAGPNGRGLMERLRRFVAEGDPARSARASAPSYPVPDTPGVRSNFTRAGYLEAVARV